MAGLIDLPEKRAPRQAAGLMDPPSYDTALDAADEEAFRAWAAERGKDPNQESADYDLRGFWKSGGSLDDRGHATDAYKKPNHPTFSTESVYSTDQERGGQWVQDGKVWVFKASPENLRHHSADELRAYFREREPGARLVLPKGAK